MATSPLVATEITLQCSDGIRLAGQSWKLAQKQPNADTTTTTTTSDKKEVSSNNDGTNDNNNKKEKRKQRRILCLHGWMDNAASFELFAPAVITGLASAAANNGDNDDDDDDCDDTELIALDLVGHGRSSHKSKDGAPTVLAEYSYYVAEAVQQLRWFGSNGNNSGGTGGEDAEPSSSSSPFVLIGHSMGAAVCCLYASAFPEQVERLVLLEGGGPLARNAADVSKHVRNHVQRRLASNNNNNGNGNGAGKTPRAYDSLEVAVRVRQQAARNFPGDQTLSERAARAMVLRGTQPAAATVDDDNSHAGNDDGDGSTGKIRFRHDPRLQMPSLLYFTQEQTESLYKDIKCPTAIILAEKGWPFDEEREERTKELLRPAVYTRLPGSHHFHADPETAEGVAQHVVQFLISSQATTTTR